MQRSDRRCPKRSKGSVIPSYCCELLGAGESWRTARRCCSQWSKSSQKHDGACGYAFRSTWAHDATTHHRAGDDLGPLSTHHPTLLPPQSRPSSRARAVLLVLSRPRRTALWRARACGLLDEHPFARSGDRRARSAAAVSAGVSPAVGPDLFLRGFFGMALHALSGTCCRPAVCGACSRIQVRSARSASPNSHHALPRSRSAASVHVRLPGL